MKNDLIKACKNNNIKTIERLLNEGKMNPSFHKNRAIRLASLHGHLEVVELLLLADKRVDPSDVNNFAIRWASKNEHLEIIKLLKQDKRVKKQMLIEKINNL